MNNFKEFCFLFKNIALKVTFLILSLSGYLNPAFPAAITSDPLLRTEIDTINNVAASDTLDFQGSLVIASDMTAFTAVKPVYLTTSIASQTIQLATFTLFSGTVDLIKSGANALTFELPGSIEIEADEDEIVKGQIIVKDTGGITLGSGANWASAISNAISQDAPLRVKDTATFTLQAGNDSTASNYNITQTFHSINSDSTATIMLQHDATYVATLGYANLKTSHGEIAGILDSSIAGNAFHKLNNSEDEDNNKLRLSGTNASTASFSLYHEGGILEIKGAQALGTGANSVPITFASNLNAKNLLINVAVSNETSFTLQNDTIVTFEINENFTATGLFSGGGEGASFIKTGSATFSIGQTSTPNTYEGTATINEGRLHINDSSAFDDMSVEVKSGAYLSGEGTLKEVIAYGDILAGKTIEDSSAYTETLTIRALYIKDGAHLGFFADLTNSTKLVTTTLNLPTRTTIIDFYFPIGLADISGLTFNDFLTTGSYVDSNDLTQTLSATEVASKFHARIANKEYFNYYATLNISDDGKSFSLETFSFDSETDFQKPDESIPFWTYLYENVATLTDQSTINQYLSIRDSVCLAEKANRDRMILQFDGATLRSGMISGAQASNSFLNTITTHVQANLGTLNAANLTPITTFSNFKGSPATLDKLGLILKNLSAQPYWLNTRATSNPIGNVPLNQQDQVQDTSCPSPFNHSGVGERGVWIQGIYMKESRKTYETLPGALSNTYGAVLGFDHFNSKGLMGFSFNYLNSTSKVEDNLGTNNSDSYGASLYGGYKTGENLHLDAALTLNHTSYKSNRPVLINGSTETAKGRWNSIDVTAHIGMQYHIKKNKSDLIPFIGIDYNYSSQGSLSETGLTQSFLHLVRERFAMYTLIPKIGILGGQSITRPSGLWMPYVSLAGRLLMPLKKENISVRLEQFTQTFERKGYTKIQPQLMAKFGLTHIRNTGVFFEAHYEGALGSLTTNHEIAIKIGKRF